MSLSKYAVSNEVMRAWYLNQNNHGLDLDNLIGRFQNEGYEWLPDAGILFRNKIKSWRETDDIDAVFPRPSTLHYHEDVGEVITVLSGSGTFYRGSNDADPEALIRFLRSNHMKAGDSITVPAYTVHGFVPDNKSHFEINVRTIGGRLDPNREVTRKPFQKMQLIHSASRIGPLLARES